MTSLRVAAAAIALIAIAACSQSEQSAETPAAPEAAAPAPAATPATAPAAPTAPAAGAVTLDVRDATGAQMSGDPAAGERVFRQCATCHVADTDVNKVGPSLKGIVGRQAGTAPGFRYSNANKNSGITWTEQELFAYLESPRTKIPGTTMSFVGVRDPQQRADLIAYLQEKAK